jgi:hypothetical protein
VVSVQSAYWSFNLYPEAGEGGGCLVRPVRPLPTGGPPNVERSRLEAARRARAKLRRYCAANRLNRLATLTYAGEGCFDPVQLREDVAEFFRGLRSGLGGEPFPYAWTSEWHPGGHGLHVHFAVGRYVRERVIRQVWGPRDHAHQTDPGSARRLRRGRGSTTRGGLPRQVRQQEPR